MTTKAVAIVMPRLGLTMEAATITDWVRSVGESVQKGEVALVIETEKSEIEVEAVASGTLRHVYVEVGETVPPEALLAALTPTPDEEFDPERFAAEYVARRGGVPPAAARLRTARQEVSVGGSTALAAPARGATATPRARRLAKQLGVDLERAVGSGPGGRITEDDVRRAQGAGPAGEVPLLPGFGSDLSVFAPQVEALAGEFRVLGLHLRGVGRSSAPVAQSYSIAEGVADVVAVLDRLAVSRVHVVGASLGAAIALELTLRLPQRVRSLTLVTPFCEPRPRLQAVLDSWVRLAGARAPGTGAAALLPWMFSDRSLADASFRSGALRGLATLFERSAPEALARWAAGVDAWAGVGAEALARLEVSTLVIAGADDLLAPFETAAWSAVPQIRCEILAAGPGLTLEAAGEACGHLLDHLRASTDVG